LVAPIADVTAADTAHAWLCQNTGGIQHGKTGAGEDRISLLKISGVAAVAFPQESGALESPPAAVVAIAVVAISPFFFGDRCWPTATLLTFTKLRAGLPEIDIVVGKQRYAEQGIGHGQRNLRA
jgi:hypothetical protein